MRLFVSVDLPDALADSIRSLQDDLSAASGLRLTDPTQVHVTLVFLGDVDPERLPALKREIRAGVDDADLEPFTVRFGGLGVFPSLEYISVVWLGVEAGGDVLTDLQTSIENRTTAMGFESNDHEFTPHVTLARIDHAGGKAHVQSLVRERSPTVGTMEVTSVTLTESTLTRSGSVYETVEEFSLE
ncbi:RNA 2',3'-cyclic phosphodiesterase [Natronosalvus vescus]|uniref:RNA 2',3'-cyclic phosphodiesterase n=1 Tax=Natronosalvus vescus TaxID=2953881 RepID=UPI0020906141|nr:RNA 2',3'-cyclic phosphodiesterase [Natronosalvus vescus]